jgi:hypothetical protein
MGSAAANALWRDKSARQAREPRKPRLRSAAVRHFLPGPCPSSLWNDSGCIEIVNGNCDFFLAKSWRAKSWGKTESWRDRIMGGQSQGNVGQGNGRGGKGRAGTPPRAPQPWRRGLQLHRERYIRSRRAFRFRNHHNRRVINRSIKYFTHKRPYDSFCA